MSAFTKDEIRKLVVEIDEGARNKFIRVFQVNIDEFIDEVYNTFIEYEKLTVLVKDNIRKADTVFYVFNAVNNLIVSFNLLISSYFSASGNIFRHMLESIIMAVVLSHKHLDKDYYSEFVNLGVEFKVNRIINIVETNKENIDFNEDDWKKFRELLKHYHKLSHASLLSLATQKHMQRAGLLIVGSEFDEGKIDAYRKEINIRISSCNFVRNLMLYIHKLLISL